MHIYAFARTPKGYIYIHIYAKNKGGLAKYQYAWETVRVYKGGLAKYQYAWETVRVYTCGMQWHARFGSFHILEEVTQGLSKSLHKAATNAFTHTTGNVTLNVYPMKALV